MTNWKKLFRTTTKVTLLTYKVFLEKSRKESPIQKWTKDMIKPQKTKVKKITKKLLKGHLDDSVG